MGSAMSNAVPGAYASSHAGLRRLQEKLQAKSRPQPAYLLVQESGPEHQKTFVVRALWEGIVLGEGTGRSKKQAETAAAIEAMREKRWEQAAEKDSTVASQGAAV